MKTFLAVCIIGIMMLSNLGLTQNNTLFNFGNGVGIDAHYLASDNHNFTNCVFCTTDSTSWENNGGYSFRPFVQFFLTFKTWNFIGSLNYDFARYSQTYSYELNTQKRNFTIDHDLRFLGYNFGIAKLFCLTPNLTLNFGISLGITKSLNNSTKIRLTKGSGITNEYLLYDFDFWRRQEIGASVSGSLNYSFGNFSEIQGAIVFEKNSRQFIEASISDESSNRELLFFSNVPIPLNRFGVSITYKRYLRVHSIHHLK